MKEYKVGQIVTIKGTKTRVTKHYGCDGCIMEGKFLEGKFCKEHKCKMYQRSDGISIIFKPISDTHEAANNQSDTITPKQTNSALDESIRSEFPLPPENMRVWIRGNKERGEEVIKALTDLGAKNIFEHDGEFENVIYYINSKKEVEGVIIGTTIASLIANFYTEIKLPYKPKDKELVWAWDDNFHFGKMLMFYDSKNRRSFNTVLGNRIGYRHDHYAPYEGEWPEWAKEALKKLEE